VQRAGVGRGDEGQVDLGLGHGRELDLGLLRRFLEPLTRHPVLGEVDAMVVLEALDEPLDHGLVPIVATQLGVTGSRFHLEHALADLEDGNVERASS
jgi:hypothetical protein